MSFLGGHWYPCFGFLGMSPLGFKARVGSALFAISAEVNVMHIPQDSTLVLHLLTSWRPVRSWSLPHMHVQRWDLAQIRTYNRTNRRRTRYHCASDPAGCRLKSKRQLFRKWNVCNFAVLTPAHTLRIIHYYCCLFVNIQPFFGTEVCILLKYLPPNITIEIYCSQLLYHDGH